VVSLSLDTNVLIDVLRRRQAVLNGWQAAVEHGTPLVLSCLVLHELEAGVELSARPDIHRARLRELLAYADIVEFDVEDARTSGGVRAALQRSGRPIGPLDTLIAGQALARGWTVVTSNVRHFGRVDGLRLIDWSTGTDPLPVDAVASRVSEVD
jgi:tRNA(fMet)-specific endonuclease VapC